MRFIRKWIKHFQKDDEPHWLGVIENMKQAQSVNNHSHLCNIKKLSDRLDAVNSEYKQLLDLVFKHGIEIADLKEQKKELKESIKRLRLERKRKNGLCSTVKPN